MLSSEVTRLSRNCTDWYPLLDLCGYRQCLIGDRDGVYDPASANGRLLLGLKGTISEMELHHPRTPDRRAAEQGRARRAWAHCPSAWSATRQASWSRTPTARCRPASSWCLPPSCGGARRPRCCAALTRAAWPCRAAPPRRRHLAPADRRGGAERAQEPRVCRGIRLWPHAVDPRCRDRDAQAKEASPRAVEDRREEQVPRLRQLGDVREDPGHAARQLCRV